MSYNEALSQPVAYTDREELESMRGPNADTYANLWTIPHGCGQDLALYSQEYVTALREDAARWFKAFEKAVSAGARYEERIAELENDEVRQRLANAEHQLYMKDLVISNIRASRKAQFKKRREAEQQITSLFERVSGEQVSNYPAGCIDWLADMIEGEMCASEGALSAMRARAEAAERRLQQPIKLPLAEGESKQEYLDKVIEVLNGAGLQIRYHCPRCNGLLDLTSRPDGDHYCHQQAKVEGE